MCEEVKVTPTTSVIEVLRCYNLLEAKTKDDRLILEVLKEEHFNTFSDLKDLNKTDLKELKFSMSVSKKMLKSIENSVKMLNNQNQNKEMKTNDNNNTNESYFEEKEEILDVLNVNKNIRYIKNPYIIITGISDYSDLNGFNNLNATINDVKLIVKLFKESYHFKHVIYVQDKINDIPIDDENFELFLLKQRDKIVKLINNNDNIDCVIFYYAGHGESSSLIFGDGSKYSYKNIQMIFNNKSLKILAGYPKLLYFDCCHGKQQIKPFSVDINSRGGNNEMIKTNKYLDMYITYGAVLGTQSYDNSINGFLTQGLYNAYTDHLKLNNKSSQFKLQLHNLELLTKQHVLKLSGNKQTVQIVNTIHYDVYFVLSNNNNKENTRSNSKSDSDINNSKMIIYKSLFSSNHKGYSIGISKNNKYKVGNNCTIKLYTHEMIRCKNPIQNGEITQVKFKLLREYWSSYDYDILIGLVPDTMGKNNFNNPPKHEKNIKYCYGIAKNENTWFCGAYDNIKGLKHKLIQPNDIISMICNFKNENIKKITFTLNNKKLTLKNKDYSFVLPNKKEYKNWYPCLSLCGSLTERNEIQLL